jgi:hypothetical protein
MKNRLLILCLLWTVSACAQSDFKNWALTPPMGWNSWDCFGPTVVESEVKANADYMAEHLKDFGWEYIIVDIRWFVENDKAGGYNQTNPIYVMDEYGRYTPALNRFPSAADNKGFKPLADYIHGKGLKFGIHIMRGIPKKAVENKLPIKGTDGITADMIYTTALQCTWLRDNYTILAEKAGAQEYYNSIFDLYASWEIDFIKIDDLSRPYHQAEIELIRKAIDRTGRPIVLSMSPGETPIEKADHAQAHANLWRTVDDFWDNWDQLLYQFGVCNKWSKYTAPGTWPDADMLPLGKISIRGERGAPRMTNFTEEEQFTLMSLWSIFKSPLMFGGNLPDNDAFTQSLITNKEVLYVNQHSTNNKQHSNDSQWVVWTADDPANNDKFVAVFNLMGNSFVDINKSIYRSGLISNLTSGHGVDIDQSLPSGTRDLFLVVSDGGDGFTADHADWINPLVYNDSGDTLRLTSLTWESATAEWGTVQKNKSIAGSALTVDGNYYANGIGTHAKSIIHYKIPEGYARFKTFAGLDRSGISQGIGGATVEFMIFTEDPSVDPTVRPSEMFPLNLVELGFEGPCTVRNLWTHTDEGVFSNDAFVAELNHHGAGLYRISPVEAGTSVKPQKDKSKVQVVYIDSIQYLKGMAVGDEIRVYNTVGQLLNKHTAVADIEQIKESGDLIIDIKSPNGHESVKVINR